MGIYDRFASLTEKFVNNGMLVPATLRRKDNKTFDVSTRQGGHNELVIECHAVVSAIRGKSQDGLTVFETIATITVEPNIGDEIHLGERVYNVLSVTETAPNGTPIVWKAVVS